MTFDKGAALQYRRKPGTKREKILINSAGTNFRDANVLNVVQRPTGFWSARLFSVSLQLL